MHRRVILIAGPTASGKSALALGLAQALGGTVINADSMQVYRDLRIVTARPSVEEEAAAPHRLYGVVDAAEACSLGRWLAMASAEIEACQEAGGVPIVVGGTGMYLSALTDGIAPVPDIPPDIRTDVRHRLEKRGAALLHAELLTRDPEMAQRLRPSDPQRIARALEVLEATGRSLRHWQEQPPQGALQWPWFGIVLSLPRPLLYARCDARFSAMLEAGALEEVATLAARHLSPDLPAMRALGVAPLLRHLEGEIDLESAVTAAQTGTRQFAKRQLTWFRHKMITWNVFETKETERFFDDIFPFVSRFLLTPPD